MRTFQTNIDDVSVLSSFNYVFYQRLCLTKTSQCAPIGYDGFDLTATWSCFNGTNSAQGVELVKAHGDQTNQIDLSFVPSIEIDNVSSSFD